MPLNTQIQDEDGNLLRLHWGDFHIAAMVLAAAFDSGIGPFNGSNWPRQAIKNRLLARRYPTVALPITRGMSFQLASYPVIGTTPLNDGEYVLTKAHKFIDPSDGEILELFPGYKLHAWRSW